MPERARLLDAPPLPDPFRFGHCELRLAERQLFIDGRSTTLGSRAFDLLVALAERRDRLVSKDELLGLVWPDLVVEENNLQVQVSALRKLLGPQAIATVAGRGYRFTAAAAPSAATPSSAPAAVPAPAPPAASSTARARLLVADDNKVNRLLISRSLELLGYEVVSADNGRAALERLRREAIDLLLLDLEMPELDGFGLLEQLAVDGELRDLPVIVTSSLEGVAHVARCIELGADDYLRKPVNPVLLKARVGASLDKKRLRDQQKELVRRLGGAGAAPGAVVPTEASRGQRIQATVLVASLGNLQALAASQSPADLFDLLNDWLTLMLDAVDGANGVVSRLGGDCLMALFGTPLSPAVGTAALAAVRAALDMQEMVETFNGERAAMGRPPIALGVGIATGSLLAGYAGRGPRAIYSGIGEPVAHASALQAHACAGGHGIVIDAGTQTMLDARVATSPLVVPAMPSGAAYVVQLA